MILYWLAMAAFILIGAFALVRPEVILAIRAKFRPDDRTTHAGGGRRSKFGPLHVRILAVALLLIGAVLFVRLVAERAA